MCNTKLGISHELQQNLQSIFKEIHKNISIEFPQELDRSIAIDSLIPKTTLKDSICIRQYTCTDSEKEKQEILYQIECDYQFWKKTEDFLPDIMKEIAQSINSEDYNYAQMVVYSNIDKYQPLRIYLLLK